MVHSLVSRLSLAVLFLYSASLVASAPGPRAAEACLEIKNVLTEEKLKYPGDRQYLKENSDYYNQGLADLGPACIVFPNSAEDVSKIVKVLNNQEGVPFAVKSGGHSPNPGHASVRDGVLIALRNLKGVVLDKDKSLVYVKPGGHWWDVMHALEGTGHMAIGGRLGVVGIGGFLLQGGLSFLSGQYGLGGDVSTSQHSSLQN